MILIGISLSGYLGKAVIEHLPVVTICDNSNLISGLDFVVKIRSPGHHNNEAR